MILSCFGCWGSGRFLILFKELNIIKELGNELIPWSYARLDETNRVASEIKERLK